MRYTGKKVANPCFILKENRGKYCVSMQYTKGEIVLYPIATTCMLA